MYVPKGTTFYTLWTPACSGNHTSPTTLPTFTIFDQSVAVDSGITAHNYTGMSGVYRISFPTTGDAFITGHCYNLSAEGTLSGRYYSDVVSTFHITQGSVASLTGLTSSVYHADVNLCQNDLSGVDRYSIVWFRNDIPLTGTTVTFIDVYNATGNLHISFKLANSVGYGLCAYNATGSLRLTAGERYVGEFYITIPGGQALWRIPLSRDYSV